MGFGAFTAVAWVQSLAGELGPHKPCSMVKKKKKKKVSHKRLKTNKQKACLLGKVKYAIFSQ